MRAFYESYQDIVNNIGRRPYNYIFSYHVYIFNNVPLFIGPFVILGIYIKNLLYNLTLNLSYNLVYFVKNYKFKFLLAVEIPQKAKNSFNYAKDMFKRKINFNFVPEHLRNFQVYPQFSRRLSESQRNNPQIVALVRRLDDLALRVRNRAQSVQRYSERLIRLIDDNGLTVYYTPEDAMAMACPVHTPPEQEQLIRRDLVSWDIEVMRAMDGMTEAINAHVNTLAALQAMGVTLTSSDFSFPLARARRAYAMFRARVVREGNQQ